MGDLRFNCYLCTRRVFRAWGFFASYVAHLYEDGQGDVKVVVTARPFCMTHKEEVHESFYAELEKLAVKPTDPDVPKGNSVRDYPAVEMPVSEGEAWIRKMMAMATEVTKEGIDAGDSLLREPWNTNPL